MGGSGGYNTPAIIFDLAGDTWTPRVIRVWLDATETSIY